MDSAKLWAALAAAALLTLGMVGLALFRRGAAAPALAEPLPDARTAVACELPGEVHFGTAAGAPVLVWAVPPVRLFIDDKPALSSPDAPVRLRGEHLLRAEARGEPPLVTGFRVEDGEPVLFHAQLDEGLGITLVRLGGSCTRCEFKDTDVSLEHVPSEEPTFALLQAASAQLREDRWRLALPRLQRVAPRDRSRPPYLRLASNLMAASTDPDAAHRLAKKIPAAKSNGLAELLEDWERLRQAEDPQTLPGLLARWNALTERFGKAAARFADDAPGPLVAATRRLEGLSAAFERQSQAKDLKALRGTLEAAEQTVLGWVGQLRSSRPDDCEFQRSVVELLQP